MTRFLVLILFITAVIPIGDQAAHAGCRQAIRDLVEHTATRKRLRKLGLIPDAHARNRFSQPQLQSSPRLHYEFRYLGEQQEVPLASFHASIRERIMVLVQKTETSGREYGFFVVSDKFGHSTFFDGVTAKNSMGVREKDVEASVSAIVASLASAGRAAASIQFFHSHAEGWAQRSLSGVDLRMLFDWSKRLRDAGFLGQLNSHAVPVDFVIEAQLSYPRAFDYLFQKLDNTQGYVMDSLFFTTPPEGAITRSNPVPVVLRTGMRVGNRNRYRFGQLIKSGL